MPANTAQISCLHYPFNTLIKIQNYKFPFSLITFARGVLIVAVSQHRSKSTNSIQICIRFAHHTKVECFTAQQMLAGVAKIPMFALSIEHINHDAKLQISL